jgi:ubiquinone biosynthesis protein UbiJ
MGVFPKGTAFMGMVMLLKPVVPVSPIMVKDTVAVAADSFVAILTSDIWELVMFPLIARSTVAPLAVVAGTVVTDGVAHALNGIKTKLKRKIVQTNIATTRNLFMCINHSCCSLAL